MWNTPTQAGKYNVAMLIEEYRHKVKIGSVERDMQIDVANCNYSPPKINLLKDICVEAGATINFNVSLSVKDLSLEAITKKILDIALQYSSGNKSKAAALLKINRKAFYR